MELNNSVKKCNTLASSYGIKENWSNFKAFENLSTPANEMKHISSRLIHGNPDKQPLNSYRGLKTPVYEAASFDFESAEELERAFRGEIEAFTYSRVSNPTVAELEVRLRDFSGAQQCLCVSSGMAAISNALITLCSAGDNLITSRYLFGNTWSLFGKTLSAFNIEARFANLEDTASLEKLIDKKTRAIFLELPTNPQLVIFNLKAIAAIAREKQVPLIVDNTVLTPYLFNCKNQGVDIEVFSNTKFISGGATSVGGSILVHDSEKWQHIPKLQQDHDTWGKEAFYKRLQKEVYRNLGACLSPNNAYLQLLGLETITLRIDKTCDNALKTALFLKNHAKVKKVGCPAMPGDKYHQLAVEMTGGKTGSLLNFELESKEACYRFMNQLKMIRRGTNFCDNKSMIIHPASTIYCDFTNEEKQLMQVGDGLIRLSTGLEAIEDILGDISEALDKT